MPMTPRVFVRILVAVSATTIALAQTPSMNLKLGLWEMTMTIDMGPTGGVDLSTVPPEQRAAVAATMRGRSAQPMVIKNCMTPDKLSRSSFTQDRPGQTCKQTVTKATATSADLTQTCTGTPSSTSTIHVEAPSPTSMKMTAQMTMTDRGSAPQKANMTMTGKWIATDCGTVK